MQEILSLPKFPEVEDSPIKYTIDKIREFYSKFLNKKIGIVRLGKKKLIIPAVINLKAQYAPSIFPIKKCVH